MIQPGVMRIIMLIMLGCVAGQTLAATPLLLTNVERPLRYRPDGDDFVIKNGAEFFNRPLY